MNQIANVCERVGADVMRVMRGIGSDSRIGPKFLFPGVGFGGSCFPKDVRALIKTAEGAGFNFSMLNEVMKANQFQRTSFLEKVRDFYGRDLKGKKLAVWGLAFKANTDDMREAPAIEIINGLTGDGAVCRVYDPKAMEHAARIFHGNSSVLFGKSQYDVLEGVDGLLLLTEWLSFREPDFERIKSLMKQAVIFDGRNQYNPKLLGERGFRYVSVGRPNV
jgi:UDPglucose 6-dehydrogenase